MTDNPLFALSDEDRQVSPPTTEPDSPRPAAGNGRAPDNGAAMGQVGHGALGGLNPLIYLPGATDGTLQWKAETFQLVNWGGFEGRVQFTFHPGATLISGASGTGKSTLLDAYIALMMPSDTPFNGASNDAVAGRARSAEQRNLLSYLRGKTDTTTDPRTGRDVDQVLRGRGTATWGATGMTFIDDRGRRFTALRVYYVPARATRSGEIIMRMATYDDYLDLAELAAAVEQMFVPKALKVRFPGIRTHDSYAAFAQTLHSRLGIGANGDGSKALRLLVRIQSGHQIRTVDELYKEMVLERPTTYAKADSAIDHFDDLEAAYLAMHTEQQKADLLSPITGRHSAMVTAQQEIDTLDTFGLTAAGDTPIVLWRLGTEAALLDAAVGANADARRDNTAKLRRTEENEGLLAGELSDAREEHRNSGGAALERLAADITAEQARRDERLSRRAALSERTVALNAPLGTQADFDRLRADAETFLATHDEQAHALRERRDDLLREQVPLLQRRGHLRAERESLSGRAGRVPKHLDDMRREVARAAGLDADELPFVAELIDIAATEGRWRVAVETVLGASARTMLVPRPRLDDFSRAIDPLRLRGRLTFVGAAHSIHRDYADDPDRIAGKLLFKDSPFSGWVQQHISDPVRNALCVEGAEDLAGDGYRVTLAGQTRQGPRGTHGRNDVANIIGFSSRDAIAEIDEDLRRVDADLAALDTQKDKLDWQIATLDQSRRAYETVQNYQWHDIDVAGSDERIAVLDKRRQEILSADDRLQALQTQIDLLEGRLRDVQEARFSLKKRTTELNEEHRTLATRQDEVTNDLDRIERTTRVVLDEHQRVRLDQEFTAAVAPGDPSRLPDLGVNLARLHQRLRRTMDQARAEVDRAAAELEQIFAAYQLTWDDPNLGRSAASYPDYARILDNIVSTGLHQRREEWRRRLTNWSGQDLVPLAGAMESCIEEIEDRLLPINDILHDLPFGANRDRLRIKLRRLAPDHVTQFRRELRVLASAATKEIPEHQLEARFKDLQRFMAQIRRRDDPRATPEMSDRDRLLDVRRHVEITAERYSTDGILLSTHSSLGGKSGGESQELVAFIVGAALRFRLGDELRVRPRFAPVFLDEGFVKSDAEFAGRAVQAWKGLGFQLIVGAPLDKVTALEPHMDEMLAITKNTTTHYSFVHRLRDIAAVTGHEVAGSHRPNGQDSGTTDGTANGAVGDAGPRQ
jgi:uncharacterized protein YPO0396